MFSSLEEKPEEGERLPALWAQTSPHRLSLLVVIARLDKPGSFMPDLLNKQDFLTASGWSGKKTSNRQMVNKHEAHE